MGWGGWRSPEDVLTYTEDLDRERYANDGIRAHNEERPRQRLRLVPR